MYSWKSCWHLARMTNFLLFLHSLLFFWTYFPSFVFQFFPLASSSFSSPCQQRKISHLLWWRCWSQAWRRYWLNTGSSSAAPCSSSSASLERYPLTDLKTKRGRSTIHNSSNEALLWNGIVWCMPHLFCAGLQGKCVVICFLNLSLLLSPFDLLLWWPVFPTLII